MRIIEGFFRTFFSFFSSFSALFPLSWCCFRCKNGTLNLCCKHFIKILCKRGKYKKNNSRKNKFSNKLKRWIRRRRKMYSFIHVEIWKLCVYVRISHSLIHSPINSIFNLHTKYFESTLLSFKLFHIKTPALKVTKADAFFHFQTRRNRRKIYMKRWEREKDWRRVVRKWKIKKIFATFNTHCWLEDMNVEVE